MKKSIKFVTFIFLLSFHQNYGWVYFWETSNDEGGYFCCLHVHGTDICNPEKRCTQAMQADLSGILDYVVRLLKTEKASIRPHNSILLQLKRFIRELMNNPYYTIQYRLLEHHSVKFYHEILNDAFKAKDVKTADKSKSKKEELVMKYLMKLGFVKK